MQLRNSCSKLRAIRLRSTLGSLLDLAEALAAKGWSNRKTGAEVLAVWRRHERRPKYPTEASVAVKLGALIGGDATWWRRQPHALAALAEVLTCAVDDVLPQGVTRVGGVEFRELPELPPLLTAREPCPVGVGGGWLGSLALDELESGAHTWIVAASGSGKSLAVRLLRQQLGSRVTVLSVRRLFDAAREAKDNVPLLVEVFGVDPATDEGALVELTRRKAATCVLAPFYRTPLEPSHRKWSDPDWEMRTDWRELFSAWVQTRLPHPERIDLEDVHGWLQHVDPDGRLFKTPGHLLALLAQAYRSGLPSARRPLQALVDESLAQVLGAAAHPWLRQLGVPAIEALLRGRLGCVDLALQPLSPEDWSALMPTNLTSASTKSPPLSPRKGSKIVDKIDRTPPPEAPPPLQAVQLLVDEGVLQAQSDGRLDAAPWIRAGIERDAVVREVKSGGVEWPLWAADESRRQSVDDALDSLFPADLIAATRRALAADRSALTSVAATEALFSAVARRMMNEQDEWRPTPEMESVLQDLGQRQLALLVAASTDSTRVPAVPVTRKRSEYSESLVAESLAQAWTFSFAVPRPKGLAPEPGWSLPGWSTKLMLCDAPTHIPRPNPTTPEERTAISRLLRIARNAVRACADGQPPSSVPELLLPWVTIDGPAKGWTLAKESRRSLLRSVPGEIVGRLLQREPSTVRAQASDIAWQAALEEYGDPLAALVNFSQPLGDMVKNCVSAERFAAAFTPAVIESMHSSAALAQLPERLLRAALSAFAEYASRTGKPVSAAAEAVTRLGPADLELLVEFVAEKYGVGVDSARRVWHFDPDRALDEARQALSDVANERSYAWFFSAPRDRFPVLLDALASAEQEPSWRTRWLVAVLPRAGRIAPRVFEMMRLATA